MATGNDELVRSSFDAFLRGDWDALAEVMDPGVEWLWPGPATGTAMTAARCWPPCSSASARALSPA